MSDYKEIARQCRLKVLELIFKAQVSHIGSNFSCIDLMTVIFEKIDLDRDKFILSKGWAAASLYYFLWRKGCITEQELNSFCQPDSKWIGLAEPIHKDILIAGGALGFGLPGALGIAFAKRLKKENGKVYVLTSDGEMQCGTTWESFAIASHHKLNNLVVIVDRNGLCAMGETDKILRQRYLPRVFKDMEWSVEVIDGHNFGQIENALFPRIQHKPRVIIANTIKGFPVSFMVNDNKWHYLHLSEEKYQEALNELKNG